MPNPFLLEHLALTHRELLVRRGIMLAALTLAVAVCPTVVVHGDESRTGAESQTTIDEVLAAWATRTAAIKSVLLTCEFETTVVGIGHKPREPVNPIVRALPSNDRVLQATAEYAFENGAYAIRKSGDVINANDPEEVRSQDFRAAFDGRTNASLLVEGDLPMGVVERTSTPSAKVVANLDFVSLGFWIEPTRLLKCAGWSVDKMSLEKDSIDVNGVPCRRIRCPRGGPRLTAAIDVDPKRAWLPVRWQTWHDGNPSTVITIDYRLDQESTPVINEWVVTTYNEEGKHASTRRARVTRLDLNVDIDDSRFKIEFPLGTHVSEKRRGGYRYNVQMPADILMPIKESDYGKTSSLSSYPKR